MHLTDPDFILPRRAATTHAAPEQAETYPPDATFVVLDLLTPWRSEHASLREAMTTAQRARFPDELLIVVYAQGHRLIAVLDATGISVHVPETRSMR
jgi:hypothetical protein